NEPKEKKKDEAPVFTKKENATLVQYIEILDWYHANNQLKTAKQFDKLYPNLKIKQPLVSSWAKNEERWDEEWVQSGAAWSAKHKYLSNSASRGHRDDGSLGIEGNG
ncbi:hypothetical protein L208DRAFT_1247234, partial [Tricholoma matsutake]